MWRERLLESMPDPVRDRLLDDSGTLLENWPRSVSVQRPDCVVQVGRRKFDSYKVLLSHFSPVLEEMIRSLPQSTDESVKHVIYLGDTEDPFDPDEWEYVYAFCDPYVYQEINETNAIMLVPWFAYLQLPHFLAQCDTILSTIYLDKYIGPIESSAKHKKELDDGLGFFEFIVRESDTSETKLLEVKNPTLWLNFERDGDREKHFASLILLGRLIKEHPKHLPKSKKRLTLALGDIMRLDNCLHHLLRGHSLSTIDLFSTMDAADYLFHLAYPLQGYPFPLKQNKTQLRVSLPHCGALYEEEQEGFPQEYFFDVLKFIVYKNLHWIQPGHYNMHGHRLDHRHLLTIRQNPMCNSHFRN